MQNEPGPPQAAGDAAAASQALLHWADEAIARGDLQAARQACLAALSHYASSAAWDRWAQLLLVTGEPAEAASIYARLLPQLPAGPAKLPLAAAEIFCGYCDASQSASGLRAKLGAYADLIRNRIASLPAQRGGAAARNRRTLRLGYVHPFCYAHPASRLLAILLEQASGACEQHVFGLARRRDAMTARIEAAATHLHWLEPSTDQAGFEQRARQIAAAGIDVLIDLAGFSSGSQTSLFAHRLAPVQLTGLGLPFATGLDCFEACFSDAGTQAAAWPGLEVQPGAPGLEPVLPLPSWICWQPVPDAPPLREPASRPFCFGSAHALAKLNQPLLAGWAELLKALPDTRLRFKVPYAGDEPVRARLRAPFAAAGIAAERVEIEPSSGYRDYLDFYNRIDCVLDSVPYPGGTTSCEALWMGVPVLVGAGRHGGGYSLLSQVGHPEWHWQDQAGLIAAAGSLAAAGPRRLTARLALRAEAQTAVAFQPAAWVRGFEQSLLAFLA